MSINHIKRSDFTGSPQEWAAIKATASMAVKTFRDEAVYGDSTEFEDALAAKKEPYGDVHYADPGYQPDGKKRYPIDTEEHIRAAHSYFSKPANADKYTPAQRAKIKARIHSAWVRVIDSKGPPSDSK